MKRHVNAVDWTDKAAVRAYRAMKAREYYRKKRDGILLRLRNRTDEQRRKDNEYHKSWRLLNHDRILYKERKRRASLSEEERAKTLEYLREYRSRLGMAERRKASAKAYYLANKDRIKARNKERWSRLSFDEDFRERQRARLAEYRKRPHAKELRRAQAVRYRVKNVEKIAEYRKRYLSRPSVIKALKEYRKRYREEHRKELNAVNSMRYVEIMERCESDPAFFAEERRKRRERYRRMNERLGKPYTPNFSSRIPDWCVKGEDYLDRGSVFVHNNLSEDQLAANKSFDLELRSLKDRFGKER